MFLFVNPLTSKIWLRVTHEYMCDGQHDSQASVGSNVLHRKPVRMRVTLSATAGVLSALTPLLIKETVFFLSENRQVFFFFKSTLTSLVALQ